MPPGLRSAAQRDIAASEAPFRVVRQGRILLASGGGLTSAFGPSGVRVRVAGGTLDLHFAGLGYSGASRAVARVGPVSMSDVVSYRRDGINEWYRNGPLGLEQGFTVLSRPRGSSGPLTVTLSLGGSLVAQRSGADVVFVSDDGTVRLRYDGLSVRDASGRPVRSAFELSRGHLLLRVWDRRARYPLRIDPYLQQGLKLTGTGERGDGSFGYAVALSADGKTALIGCPDDNGDVGAAWIITHTNSGWVQQGQKLTGDGEVGTAEFGLSVALSANGNTALIGGWYDDNGRGAAWVFTRTGSKWTAQGEKLTARGETGQGAFGSVSLSADGNTALIGAPGDNNEVGAVWVFKRSGSIWTQQGTKLTGRGETGGGLFGVSVALSSTGNTALVGGSGDNDNIGAAWVLARSASGWAQQGAKLIGRGETNIAQFGSTVALSARGNTALIGGAFDNHQTGAAWVFTRENSTWNQQGKKLTGQGEAGGSKSNGPVVIAAGEFGGSVALSAAGNVALIGGSGDYYRHGAAWVFTRSGSTWSELGKKLTGRGEDGTAYFGDSVALSGDGRTALIGGTGDSSSVGAAWVFNRSAAGVEHP